MIRHMRVNDGQSQKQSPIFTVIGHEYCGMDKSIEAALKVEIE